jgi:redox-sensing transcriptional repressor
MKSKIPVPTVERLTILCTILDKLESDGVMNVSSSELGEITGVQPNTIRKDINFIGQPGAEAGYNVKTLKNTIEVGLGLQTHRKACIVGLGDLGSTILNFSGFLGSNIKIEAGFDSNINRLETFKTDIPLFPAYRIEEIVRNMQIELGVLTVSPASAQSVTEKLIQGGIKGILNFTPVVIKTNNSDVSVRNIHMLEEFRILSALISHEA